VGHLELDHPHVRAGEAERPRPQVLEGELTRRNWSATVALPYARLS
jgi:hypothetical protein